MLHWNQRRKTKVSKVSKENKSHGKRTSEWKTNLWRNNIKISGQNCHETEVLREKKL